MNQILKFLNSHASCRQFTERNITGEKEKLIITTAQRSPTSSNIQAYSIIGVRDSNKKNKLATLCGNQKHVSQSSLFLVFCADLYRLSVINSKKDYPFHGEYTEMFIVATVDCTLAAGRALMTAQALGMGGVMVGGIRNNPEEVSSLLKLPQLVYPVMGMSLGFPVKEVKTKPRLDSEAVYFKEYYTEQNFDNFISDYDRVIKNIGYLDGREVEPEKYSDFKDEYSWSEHTARRMASDTKGSLRPHLREFLENKGFLKK